MQTNNNISVRRGKASISSLNRIKRVAKRIAVLIGSIIGLAMTDGTINLHTLDSIAEYYEQGENQHICVDTSKYFLKADTLVFTATMDGKTIATVEISLNDYSILQCRPFANGICEYTEQIAGIINANKGPIAGR